MNKRSRMVIFAPHPDDETLGCGGTIARKVEEGDDVIIVVMTDGRHAFSEILKIESDPTPEELKEIRKKEIEKATGILGVPCRNVLFLDFEDGMLEHYEKEAEERVSAILMEEKPAEIYYPYERDSNSDHRATNRIVGNATKKSGFPILRYRYSITQTYSRAGPIIDSILNFFKGNMIGFDISKFIDLKRTALKEFKSQTAIISSEQKKPILSAQRLEMHLKNKEIFHIDKHEDRPVSLGKKVFVGTRFRRL